MAPGITADELARATLARQHLLERTPLTALALTEQLVGLQSQAPEPPHIGLWTRAEGFDFAEPGRLLEARELTRLTVMRGTVHLVTARDALGLRPLLQPLLDRMLAGSSWARGVLHTIDRVEFEARCREAFAEGPQLAGELAERLQPHWPHAPLQTLANAMKIWLPVVQLPPRGVWGQRGRPRFALADEWLGHPFDPYRAEQVVRRYLGAFGPASVADAQQWSGLTRLRPAFDALGDELVRLTGPGGDELFDLPAAPRPAADAEAPVRLLPQWDNLLLAHADRTRFMSERQRRAMATKNGMNPAVVIAGGRVVATYRLPRPRRKGEACLTVEPFATLGARVKAAVRDEARALAGAMGAPWAGARVEFAPAGSAYGTA